MSYDYEIEVKNEKGKTSVEFFNTERKLFMDIFSKMTIIEVEIKLVKTNDPLINEINKQSYLFNEKEKLVFSKSNEKMYMTLKDFMEK
jgi:hypothetical protein